ncbi:MAG: hypothetical protein EOQ39_28350 [Mesorhizobium sp.]|nr:MAG: hypothetical protein EOQ37_26835 [Mesorhizobium sp.]RWB11186.1 MAG: hypothetical protein EOQ39_28350 [Mesorhizobium sp.]
MSHPTAHCSRNWDALRHLFYAIPKARALFPGKPLHTFSGIALGNQQGGYSRTSGSTGEPIERQSGADMARRSSRIGESPLHNRLKAVRTRPALRP